jgi:hypothetical protein
VRQVHQGRAEALITSDSFWLVPFGGISLWLLVASNLNYFKDSVFYSFSSND